jgi:hypothetical protein
MRCFLSKLTDVRDRATEFISHVDSHLPAEMKSRQQEQLVYVPPVPDIWIYLPEFEQQRADQLRSDVRQVMADIGQEAQKSILLDESDVRVLGLSAKKMAACLRFKMFKSWGIYIHHDEGSYIGMDPPGQSEDDAISTDQSRTEFLDAYRKTIDLMDFMSARREGIGQNVASSNFSRSATLSYQPGTAFIMMWINPNEPQLSDVKDVVKEVFGEFNIRAIRADEIEHSDGITDRIVEEIRQSEYLFADLTGERPSVYYEIGYAHAIGKPVILYRRKGTTIHFDLAYRNCPE